VILGVEVREDSIAAVALDDSGVVTKRARRDGASAESASDAVRAAMVGAASAIGIALRDPLESGASDIVGAIAAAADAALRPRVVTRGTAVALAEQWRGAAKGNDHVAVLTAADVVHAGIVIDGKPFEGAHGLAGAAAWLALNPVEREDYRKLGCLEAEVGGAGIVRRLVWRIKSGDRSRVLDMAGGDMGAIQVQQIFDAAKNGDGVSISVIRDTARYIGMAIANLVAIADPNIVVLGGLIAENADQLLQGSQTEALRRLPPTMAESLTLVAAIMGEEAGPVGAARASMLAR
jgi:predicted NBD/HSP70 family sugar kinase